MLVFLPGEREIRDTAEALEGAARLAPPAAGGLDVVPLYSRLSAAEQHRVFAPPGPSRRRVVLATNVAETSLTVPGVRYVVDTGVARISRYSARTKVQRLPIEPISQASANQRAGRCGRVAAGVAIRLYSEEDYRSRPEFTDPEILRTNLASVLLQMASLGLGDLAGFPFLDPPDRRHVTAGVQLLEELGAWDAASRDGERRLSRLGRRLARLPIDPRLARMVLEAERLGCVREVVVIAAALSLQDPRERPGPDRPEERARADQLHARFRAEGSDFLTWLTLWRHLREQQRELSGSAFRRMCRREHLNYLRVREWQDFESQLRQVYRELSVRIGPATGAAGATGATGDVDADGIHQSLLAGLLSHIGLLDSREKGRDRSRGPREYLGARNTKFAIWPGSVLHRKHPDYVMAAELVETGRLWGRQVAGIDPAWAERLGSHLVKRSWSEPHWSRRRAAATAYEKVTLYGVPLAVDRPVPLAGFDPALSRELFIRHALVQGEWHTRHRFLERNRRLLEEAEQLEHRARRRGIVVDEETLFDFYDARVPAEVVSGAHFDTGWKRVRDEQPDLLIFDPAMLTSRAAEAVREEDYPTQWRTGADGGLSFPISYVFEPGAPEDGLTIELPVAALNRVGGEDFSWSVPGLRQELVTSLLRSLPKELRVAVVPAPDTAREFLAAVPAGEQPLLDALERHLRSTRGVVVPRDAWDWSKVPAHLRPTYRLVDETGREQARGKDLDRLKQPMRAQLERAMTSAADESGLSRTGLTTWAFGTVEPSVTMTRAGHEVVGYPAVVDESRSVGLRVVGSEDERDALHRHGVARLLQLQAPDHGRELLESLSTADRLALAGSPYPSVGELLADCRAAVALAVVDGRPPVREEEGYAAALADLERDLSPQSQRLPEVVADVLRALAAWRVTDKALSGRAELAMLLALADMKAQVARLVHPGFVAEAGVGQLRHYPRYLGAVDLRLERLLEGGGALERDRLVLDRVAHLEDAYRHQIAALPEGRPPGERLRRVRWLLEELRVSLWAQQLGTAVPVSERRVRAALDGAA